MADHKVQSTDQIIKQAIENIRKDFYNVYQKNIENGEFHEDDLKRVKENDEWIRAFYSISDKNHDTALIRIKDALKWRKEIGVNDFFKTTELPFPAEYKSKEALFFKGTDKNGTPLLHLITRLHKKGVYPHDLLCKFIAYQFEKQYKFNYDHQLIIVYNLIGAGIGNMDMELVKFLVNCALYYYPRIVAYAIVLEMPLIFKAAWKIIKLWLSPATAKLVKFVDKDSIKEYVEDKEVLKDYK